MIVLPEGTFVDVKYHSKCTEGIIKEVLPHMKSYHIQITNGKGFYFENKPLFCYVKASCAFEKEQVNGEDSTKIIWPIKKQ